MSLSSFLLDPNTKSKDKGKGKAIDKGLDDLFRSNTAAASTPASGVESSKTKSSPLVGKETSAKDKKRKQSEESAPSSKSKKLKTTPAKTSNDKPEKPSKKLKEAPPPKSSHKSEPVKDKRKHVHTSDPETSLDEDGEPEASSSTHPTSSKVNKHPEQSDSESNSDDEGDPSTLVHESVVNNGKAKPVSSKTKHVPEGETSEQRDRRTVFVGNVPVDVVKAKPLQKQFKRHIVSFAPTAKIESVRFRSVAFNKPTVKLSPLDGSAAKPKDGRQHDRDRAATWRASTLKGEDEDTVNPSKSFLSSAEKKRVAFIKHEFHEGVDAVNAYVVFAHPPPLQNAEKTQDAHPARVVMDPYEAARTVIKEADASVFMGRTLRIDAVRAAKAGGDNEVKGDPKATVFVGNLDFASKEEDLRAFFEALMVTERGEPGQSGVQSDGEDDEDDGEEDDDEEEGDADSKGKAKEVKKPRMWVKRVRIIRDKETLLGKGFAYVQFAGSECVDEVLVLEPERLKFAKRKLRVQRCKTLPGASKPAKVPSTKQPHAKSNTSSDKGARPARRASFSAPVAIPKGDPNLGQKLAGLSKEERKAAKATDSDRVARRLAKKQAKALAEKGVKSKPDAKAGDLLKMRKHAGHGDKGNKPSDKKKGRVRSNRALAKMNTKK